METTIELSYMAPRAVKPLQLRGKTAADTEANIRDALGGLSRIGIGMDERAARNLAVAMDSLQAPVTTPSIGTPIQFLQNWLPGFVYNITQARKIDTLIGITTSGAWEDEEVVQGVMELTGTAVPYGDATNVPLSSWNTNYEKRTVVRFEEGMRVGVLEEARASRQRVDSAASKRQAATLALEINRNLIGFFGYQAGANNTWGFLNDPNLLPITAFATGTASSTLWSRKTFLEITADIRSMVSDLRAQSGDVIDPEATDMTLALGTSTVDYLSVTSDYGVSVRDWMTKTYPRIRVISAPELDRAHSNDNVAYLYAERVEDMSTDNGRVWDQIVPSKFQLLGTQKLAKGYEEDYSNATAGALCKRPFAVVRRYGN